MIILVAPDSFKGSLSAAEAAQAMARGVLRACPGAEVRLRPLADGGEGTLAAALGATGGGRCTAEVTGAHGSPLRADYGVVETEQGQVAVIEVAQVVGLTLPGVAAVPVAQRTTRGVGELLRRCLELGLRRFWVGLGGSATNDGGCGMLAALGVRFLDRHGTALKADLEGLGALAAVDFSALDVRLKECEITLLSDVDNPLFGPGGATDTFGPQKGVRSDQLGLFDGRLARLGLMGDIWFGAAISVQPGSGAAGGLGYAFRLLGARNRSGAEAICDLVGLDAALQGADLLITGEGRSDTQTPRGKAPWVAAQHAQRLGVPTTLISGTLESDALPVLSGLFSDCLALARDKVGPAQAMKHAVDLLADRAAEATRKRLRNSRP